MGAKEGLTKFLKNVYAVQSKLPGHLRPRLKGEGNAALSGFARISKGVGREGQVEKSQYANQQGH